jgi:hypothetical protein
MIIDRADDVIVDGRSDPQRSDDALPYVCVLRPRSSVGRMLPERCRHPIYSGVDAATGEIRSRPCRRWSCSHECHASWRWYWSSILLESSRDRPPTHVMRLTRIDEVTYASLRRSVQRYHRSLHRHVSYHHVTVLEHVGGRPHHHLLVRAGGDIPPSLVSQLWHQSCPGGRVTSYVRPIRDVRAAIRYTLKHMTGVMPELPPEGYRGRLLTYSRGYLSAPSRVLWQRYITRRYGGSDHRSPNGANGEVMDGTRCEVM